MFADQLRQLISFVGADVDEEIFLSCELVHCGEDGGRGAAQVTVQARSVVDVFEQSSLAAVVRFYDILVIHGRHLFERWVFCEDVGMEGHGGNKSMRVSAIDWSKCFYFFFQGVE